MSGNGRKYNKEFKHETVKLIVEKGRSVPRIAADLGVNEKVLYRWVAEHLKHIDNAFPGSGS